MQSATGCRPCRVSDKGLVRRHGRQIFPGLALLAAVLGSLVVAPSLDGLLGGFLAALMLAIAVVDSRRYIIPNALTGTAVVLALFRAGMVGPDAGLRAMLW